MTTKRLAFIYPGQGSQHVGMARDLFDHESYAHFLHEADISLKRSITRVMFDGPEERLKETINAQPAIFLHEVAVTHALKKGGYYPVIVAGHSVGEFAALTAANVLDYGHALWLIDQRAALMNEAGTAAPGGMAAILGLDDDEVARCCAEVGANVVVANYNCPGQVVISGDKDSLNAAMERCRDAGSKRSMLLPVSGAFHSPLVHGANESLAENINRIIFRDPEVPVVTNYDGLAHTSGERIRDNLLKQMVSSVQWTKTMRTIADFGVDAIIEVGPGSVLSGLAKRITPDIPTYQVGTVAQLEAFSL